MEFPFSTLHTYFKPAELRRLERFLENEPSVHEVYTNAKGESRTPMRVFLPMGLITAETVYGPPPREGGRVYHTPRATVPGAVAKINYKDDEGGHTCDSDEWMKWLGKKWEAEEKDEPATEEMSTEEKEALLAMHKRSVQPDTEDNDGAKWEPLGVKTNKNS